MNLKDTHPSFNENICVTGNWTVQRRNFSKFTSIACDQAIEQTVNRDTKTSGGLRGFSLNRGNTIVCLYVYILMFAVSSIEVYVLLGVSLNNN